MCGDRSRGASMIGTASASGSEAGFRREYLGTDAGSNPAACHSTIRILGIPGELRYGRVRGDWCAEPAPCNHVDLQMRPDGVELFASLSPAPLRARKNTERKNRLGFIVRSFIIALFFVLAYVEFSSSGYAEFSLYATISTYFWVCLFGTLIPAVTFLSLRRRHAPGVERASALPFISIVIPAFNEERKICQAIDAALKQDYPLFEVIVVDDGSRDFTRFVAECYRVRLIHQRSNQGKFAALNRGIAEARGEIIVTSDSDSMLDPDALKYLAHHFDDPLVGAVAGAIRPMNCRGLVRRLQCIEYVWGQEILKLAQSGSGASVTLCPGPVTAFRRATLDDIGGFKGRTVTEDFDATLDAIAAGWKVIFEPRAKSLTDTPANWAELMRQRQRWSLGALQTFLQHRALLCNRSAGLVSAFWLPWFVFSSYVTLALDLAMVGLILPFVVFGPTAALLAKGAVFGLIIELVVVVQYQIGLVAAGERRPSFYAAAFLMKPLTVLLAWTRLRAVYLTLARRDTAW